jgi:formate dehydrogenase alpha subunit
MIIRFDGREVTFEGSKSILEVARENGIYIPSLCDHPLLTPFSGCRLCLVEVKGRRGYVPACSLQAEDGLEVTVNSPVLEEIRRQTLELILSEHPNACLVCSEKERCEEHKATIRKVGEVTGCVFCPKNNHCELQEVVRRLGVERVRFPSTYRGFELERRDPFFDRNYNLCILCGRCVRVCQEVRGATAIAFVFRGSQTVIGTPFNQPLLDSGCQFCGACVDVCPVGALTERALRVEVAPEKEVTTVCPFCSQGCQLRVKVRESRILGAEPATEQSSDPFKTCVRGRFLLREVVNEAKRLPRPFIRADGELREVSWPEALDFVAAKLSGYKGEEIGLVLSPHLPLEDIYLLSRLANEVLASSQLAFTSVGESLSFLENVAQSGDLALNLNYRPEDITQAKSILVGGGDLAALQPGLWVEVHQALRQGAKLVTLDSLARPSDRHATLALKALPEEFPAILERWLSLLSENLDEETKARWLASEERRHSLLSHQPPIQESGHLKPEVDEAWSLLMAAKPVVFLVGPGLTMNSSPAILSRLWHLAVLAGAKLIPFGFESNARGAGEMLRRLGLRTKTVEQIQEEVEKGHLKALLCFGSLPAFSGKTPEFLVVADPYQNELLSQAQVGLPVATALERPGIYVSNSGLMRQFPAAIAAAAETGDDWQVAAELGRRLSPTWPLFANEAEIRQAMLSLFPEIKALLVQGDSPSEVKQTYLSELRPPAKAVVFSEKETTISFKRRGPLRILIEPNLDYYRSLHLAATSRDLRLLRHPQKVIIHPEEAARLGLREEEMVILKNAGNSLTGIVKLSRQVPLGTLVINFTFNGFPGFSSAPFLASCFTGRADGSVVQEAITVERGS